MPLNTQMTDFAVEVQADALAVLLDSGYIDVLTAPQPDNGNETITTQTVLVTMSFGRPAFMKSDAGVISANPINAGMGIADGDPRWFRAYRADHKTAIFDGSAGKAKDNNMVLPAKTIVEGVTVGCSGLTHTVRKSMPGV